MFCTIIPWGHKTADFVALGFGNQESDEDEDEDDHKWEQTVDTMHYLFP